MKAVSKEMRKRQKHFPWLKTFVKEFFRTYPSCKKTLQYLLENIEKEVKELKIGPKKKTKVLFETVNDLYLHFWWKIHWKQSSLWKNYCNVNTPHSYQCSETLKCFGKLLNFLIYLGIILSQGASDSLWINRVLQAINILPVNDEIVFDALLQLHILKKKYRRSYMKILRHILCSQIILNISEPAVYVKILMLFRRLKNYTEDEVAKASLISTASRIKPPQKLASWLSSLEISVDVSKSIADQLFKKNSKQVFQNFYHVLIDSENSGSNNKEKDAKVKKKFDKNEPGNKTEEENILKMAVGIIDTSNKDINCNFKTIDKINIDGENNQIKKVLHLPKLCNQIKNSKKKKKNHATNKSINLVNSESNTKSTMQLMNTKTGNLIKTSLDSQNNSTKLKKTKKKKKPKAKTGYIETTVTSKNNDTKSKETSKNKKSGSKGKKSKKKKEPKEINKSINEIPNCKKSDSLNLETHSNETRLSKNGDSVLDNNKLPNQEGINQGFKDANDSFLSKNNVIIDKEKSNNEENSAIKKLKLTQSAIENQISQTDKGRYNVSLENSNDKILNRNDLRSKLPNLLANYEIYSSADENETAKRDVSSCPLVESGDNVLVPDTCQNDFNSIVPFNLDSWIPSKDDTSISNNDSLNSDKYPFDSLNVIKRTNTCRDNQSDNLSFSDSAFEYINDSEVSRDTFVSNDGSQISDKYPYVSLIDIRKNKKWRSYQNSDYSNSSFDDSVTRNIKDSEVSQDTCISYDGSQISDKIPFVSLVDIKKMKNRNLYEKSSCSNSSYDSSCVENINISETSENDCISSEESQISNKNPNNIKKVDKIDHHNDLNYDPILGNLNSKEIIDTSNQNPDNSLCHDPYISENRKDKSPSIQGKNRNVGNENKVSELPPDETLVQSKQFHENQSPCEKHLKTGTQSMEQDLDSTNLKTKTNSPIKRLRKQTNYNTRNQKNQNPDNSLCHDPYISESRKDKSPSIQGKNRNVGNESKISELPPDETLEQSKQFHENQSPCEKHSKTGTQSMEQDLVSTNLKTKTNSPIKRLRKQTNYNTRKKQGKRKCSSDNIKDLVQPQEEEKRCQELETSAIDANGDVYMNDLSTLLPNHGDIETQENETTSPSTDIALNHSNTQDLSQFQEHANCKEPNILSHDLNGKQSASLIFQANTEQQPCVTFPNANHQSDVPTCSIETVIDEFIESELSKVHGSCNNLNPGRLSNNITEKTHAGSVHSVDKNAYSPFQTNSDLVPSDCFSYKSNLNPSPQNNNQSNILSVSSSSAIENRSIENEVARSLLNLSVNENPQAVALPTNPDHRKENTNLVNANLHQGNSTYIVDCNIINDFDSRNSSRAGSSVSGDTTTIKVVLNLINAKPENSSSPQNPNSLGNSFLAASNSSQGLHSSVASGQVMNHSNCSFPMHRSNSYFSAPPFFSRTVNELDTPPDSESHLRMPSIPMVKNTVSPCSEDKANFISSSKSNGRSSTPKSLSRKRQQNEFSHSSESTNEWGVNKLDLNSSFSDIRSLQCEDAMNTLNVRQKRNNHSAKDKQNKKSISRTADHSISNGKNTAFPYRNSRPSIYSDESEDDLSVSTMSLLSGEETDHSLLKTTDNEISPKSPLQNRENNSSKNKRWTSTTLTNGSLIESIDNKISTKSPLHRKNNTRNKTKKLFREEKWALDSLTIESSVNEPSTVLGQPTAQKKKKPIKVTKTVKKPKTSLKRDYNLRSRPLLTPPAKLMSYIT